ncbi:ribonuclease III [Methylococcus geothermalis]|uniref:Ribonuclease 3 n=1 Tax=Methylococcus geothermalis TaxID=2681310 RepID=A0A858Q8C2_9GAMM|nr:ribonuclease III [Methylococcus geothermalis]QJD30152.1 ribonuclease III [Methylococcus geothermalis]
MIRSHEHLARKLGVPFSDPSLLRNALTHRSAEGANNERLEFLGDSVLGFVVAEYLYQRFPSADEGVLSRLRATLVNETALAKIARELDLGEYLILGSGELKSGGYRRDSILSDALEAVLGAVLQDQGIDACRTLILQLFERPLSALSLDDWKKDPKTRLQELMQGRGLPLPVYTLIAQSGLPHDQHFQVRCEIPLQVEPCLGEGSSRKKAEQQAAENMLNRLSEQSRISV